MNLPGKNRKKNDVVKKIGVRYNLERTQTEKGESNDRNRSSE